MKIIILVLLGLTLTSSIHQSGEKNGRKMSCKSMLSMPEYNQESNEDVNSALLTLESSEHKHYHSFDEPYEPKTHHSNEDVMINKLFVQNQASQHFKKTRGSNQGVESIFLGMKTGDDPKDHIPKEDVKDRLIEADEEIKAEFEQCRQDLHEQAIENAQDFNMSLANLTEAIHFACVKMEKEIKHMMDKQADKEIEMLRNATMNITKKLREIGDDVDDTVESNIRLRMLWLRVKIAKDTEELGIVQSQADALEVQIPPPESICEMYLECSMCLANPKCGWCTRENMCVEGDEVAPLHYVCLQYDFSVCRGESCNMNIDCDVNPNYFLTFRLASLMSYVDGVTPIICA